MPNKNNYLSENDGDNGNYHISHSIHPNPLILDGHSQGKRKYGYDKLPKAPEGILKFSEVNSGLLHALHELEKIKRKEAEEKKHR